MRKQLVTTVEKVLENDSRVVVLLGDIGVHGFSNAFKAHPDRIYNIGILEPTTVGLASGMAFNGQIPIVHTITPFLVERSFEQLKLDFGYQALGGNFISVGASYDYAALGCTHHAPGDVGVLKTIPEMEIVLPGTSAEFDRLFVQSYADGKPTYFRLSGDENEESYPVEFGKAVVIKKGTQATIVAVGTALKEVMKASADFDVTILYYTTVTPFDYETLKENYHEKVLLVEPYYQGGLVSEIMKACFPRPVIVEQVGVPHMFLRKYGTYKEHNVYCGLDSVSIRKKLDDLIAL